MTVKYYMLKDKYKGYFQTYIRSGSVVYEFNEKIIGKNIFEDPSFILDNVSEMYHFDIETVDTKVITLDTSNNECFINYMYYDKAVPESGDKLVNGDMISVLFPINIPDGVCFERAKSIMISYHNEKILKHSNMIKLINKIQLSNKILKYH